MTPPHNSPFAGSWYPESPAALGKLLSEAFESSRRRTGPFIPPGAIAYVVPHASPAYSGIVAAAVYRALEFERPQQIIVLAFPHHGGLRGVATADVGAISTPFGNVCLEPEDYPQLPEAELCDHSFEIQLPFLQTAAPHARITPLYIGRMTEEERHVLAATLAARWRPGMVFLASTDFTHYGRDFHYVPFPPDETRLRDLDFECIDAAGSLDSTLFLQTLDTTGATVCGRAPVALLLDILGNLRNGGIYQATLDYQTSADITGDQEHSVSYAALAYYHRATLDLSADDGEALLDAAEAALRALRECGRREPLPARGSAALEARRGAFVTLRAEGELLGCIGNASSGEPLAVQVPALTLSAALDDPRFRPVAECSGPIHIEISVLTPFRRLRDESELLIGTHGAMLKVKQRSGLLLPQVAEDHGWTSPQQFLAALARKIHLPRDAWRLPGARLFAFEAQRFSRPGLRGRS